MRLPRHISTPFTAAVLAFVGLQGCSSGDPEAERASSRELQETESGRTVPPGTSLVFSVDQIVSTATHARGDVFSATLRHRVTDVEGSEAIPEGVPSQWIVTEASTEDGATVLAIRLESIRVDGSWTPLIGDVTEAHLRTSTDSARTSGPEVAVGAEANAVLVEIRGEDGVTASGVGASAPTDGTTVTLTARGRSAILPAGSSITVQLTEPLEV